MPNQPNPHVAFEGPLAVGKTTLAKLLADHAKWDLLLEQFDDNEFLADFYSAPARWALPMQLSFLAGRHEQLAAVRHNVRPLVTDYTYAKDEMFARLLLKEEREWRLYSSLQKALGATTVHPTLVVLLDAPNEVLLERIRLRGRPYETSVTAAYLDELRVAYRAKLLNSMQSKVIEIDTSMLDLHSVKEMLSLYEGIISAL